MNQIAPYLDHADSDQEIGKHGPNVPQVQDDSGRAAGVTCEAAKKFLLHGTTADQTYRSTCKRWSCPACSRHSRRLCAHLIEAGMLEAFDADLRARYFVITSLPDKLTPTELQVRWNSFRTSFVRKGEFQSYATTIEVVDGRPHLNVVTVGGKFIHTSWLNRISSNAGLGRVWVSAVGSTETDASRLSKYVTKGARTATRWSAEGGSKRVQPVRLSKGWKPFRITEGRRRNFRVGGTKVRKKNPFYRARHERRASWTTPTHPSSRRRG